MVWWGVRDTQSCFGKCVVVVVVGVRLYCTVLYRAVRNRYSLYCTATATARGQGAGETLAEREERAIVIGKES